MSSMKGPKYKDGSREKWASVVVYTYVPAVYLNNTCTWKNFFT